MTDAIDFTIEEADPKFMRLIDDLNYAAEYYVTKTKPKRLEQKAQNRILAEKAKTLSQSSD